MTGSSIGSVGAGGGGLAGVSIGVSTGVTGASVTVGVVLISVSAVIKILNKEFFERPPRAKKTPWYSTLLKELKIKFSFLIFLFQKQKRIIIKIYFTQRSGISEVAPS